MPKAWKKEMEATYGALSPEVMQYIHEREGNVSRGFQQYQASHDNWTKLVTPYQDVLAQHPDVNPVELMGNLMQTHLALLRGTPEQKQALASEMLKVYGINLGAAPEHTTALAQLQSRIDAFERQAAQQQQAKTMKEVEAFFADPAHKHAKTVHSDMQRLLSTGACQTLQEAYDQACWLNPDVRKALLEDQAKADAEKARADAEANRRMNIGAPDSLSNTAPRKAKSWEDGVDALVQEKYSGANNRH